MKLTRDNLKDLFKKKSKEIKVGDFEVNIVEMTIPQQLEIESILKEKKNNSDLIAPVLKFCVVDDEGQPLLDDAMIKSIPAAIAVKIFQECIELNSISEKDLETRAKNS